MAERKPRPVEPSTPPLNPGDQAPPGTAGTGEVPCKECGGSGKVRNGPCRNCGGTGRVVAGIGGA